MSGYRRSDGLWDIEGTLSDTKTYDFENSFRGTVKTGDHVHLMRLCLTVDDQFVIRDVGAFTDYHPYSTCPEIADAYRKLIGVSIGPGFSKKLRELMGGRLGCSHLTRLVQNLATVAFQTIGPLRAREVKFESKRMPPHLDGCHALRLDGEVVKAQYARWYRSGIGNGGADE